MAQIYFSFPSNWLYPLKKNHVESRAFEHCSIANKSPMGMVSSHFRIFASALSPPKAPSGCQQLQRGTMEELLGQWEVQDPKMGVLYYILIYFGGNIPLHSPETNTLHMDHMVGTPHFRILEFPLTGLMVIGTVLQY